MAVLGPNVLNNCSSIPDFIAGGSRMIFEQSSAPPSWTKLGTHNNKALRVVTGPAEPFSGTAFTTVFASRTPAGTVTVSGGSVGNTTLQVSQIPSHQHGQRSASTTGGGLPVLSSNGGQNFGTNQVTVYPPTAPTGGDGAHSHPFSVGSASFSGSAQNFAVSYVDVIICSKD
jgi:hypothetical protein